MDAEQASISLAAFAIVASSFSFLVVRVLISNPLFLEKSSHHSKYSLYAFASSSPALVTFAVKASMSSITFDKGFDSAVTGNAAMVARVRIASDIDDCIGALFGRRGHNQLAG